MHLHRFKLAMSGKKVSGTFCAKHPEGESLAKGTGHRFPARSLGWKVNVKPLSSCWVAAAVVLLVDLAHVRGVAAQETARFREVLVDVEGEWEQRSETQTDANPFEATEKILDQWVFNQSPDQAHQNYDMLIRIEIERIDQVCGLTPDQERLLRLAGEGEKQRVRETLGSLHAKYAGRSYEQEKTQEIFQELQDVRTTVHRRPLAARSMLSKLLRSICDDEQAERWAAWKEDRRRVRRQREIRAAVATIEQQVPLRRDQRRSLMDLLEAKVRPVAEQQRQEARAAVRVMNDSIIPQMNAIPPEAFQAFLEPEQWEALQDIFLPHRGHLRSLQEQGLLLDRIDPAPDSNGPDSSSGEASR